jgi:tetratricopeptide (TPR) repeat protein
VAADKAGDYKAALGFFQDANQLDVRIADVLNMLAHSQRMLGMIDNAIANYKKALSLRPISPQAREYLGAACIQAALHEIEILKNYGSSGDEFRNDLIGALKAAGSGL